ncbi:MAG: tRNA pseudouridine(38-40) synthase TruA [SAR202 cluster bacterium]|nr:tRNA pseudouridine(38-40) synthase TruA [SAR202 cluster bacterium]
MRLALVVEYDGTAYSGFQHQAKAPSVQQQLERAINNLTGEFVRVKGAGRTDAGVHALGQVVAFDTSSRHGLATFQKALNHYLPADISVKWVGAAPDDFDPRRHARSRRYRYVIYCAAARSPLLRRITHHVSARLDVGAMRTGAAMFEGVHDFAGFAAPLARRDASTVREVFEAGVVTQPPLLTFEVEGNAFLPHQVRRMAGALVDVGLGKITPVQLKAMIDRTPVDCVARALPPEGLCLIRVNYDDFRLKVGETDGNEHTSALDTGLGR